MSSYKEELWRSKSGSTYGKEKVAECDGWFQLQLCKSWWAWPDHRHHCFSAAAPSPWAGAANTAGIAAAAMAAETSESARRTIFRIQRKSVYKRKESGKAWRAAELRSGDEARGDGVGKDDCWFIYARTIAKHSIIGRHGDVQS